MAAAASKSKRATAPPVEDNDALILPQEDEGDNSTVSLYLRDIRDMPPLPDEEIRELGRLSRIGKDAKEQLKELDDLPPECIDEMNAVIKQGKDAEDRLIEHNLAFVFATAKTFISSGIPLEDLVQEGNLALVKAAERYDPEKGKFLSYAGKWIKNAIIAMTQTEKWHGIGQSHDTKKGRAAIQKARKQLSDQGIEPTPAAVAAVTKYSEKQVKNIDAAWEDSKMRSLAERITDKDGDYTEFGDTIPDGTEESLIIDLTERSTKQVLRQLMREVLDPIEEICLVLCFGLEDETPRTYEAVGKEIGYAKSSVYSICERAKEKLREANRKRDYLALFG